MINLHTTSFQDVLDYYMKSLAEDNVPDDQTMAANYGFVAGMGAGVAVLQNRMAEVILEYKGKSAKERGMIFEALGHLCGVANVELEKMNMEALGQPYGTG